MANESMEVLKRVEMIIKDKGMSKMAFSREIDVPQRTLNSNLSGSSKPSFELMTKILERFPEISAEWLFRGTGEMYLYQQCNEVGEDASPTRNEDINSRLQALQDELNKIRQKIC